MTERVLGSFALSAEVGRGGMGVVYSATDQRDGSKAAVKILSRSAGSDDALARFEREISALCSLEHPGVVRYRGHGSTDDGEPYLAMDWIDGEDLSARLERGPLSPPETVALGCALARSLAAVHARGLVHRDLKPSNVLLAGGDPSRPVLVDFGIARSVHARTMTRTGSLLGTPQYMSPEQVQGSRAVDSRTDLFALGLILHECLTGRPVFEGEHFMAVLAKVLVEPPPPLAAAAVAVPPALEALIASLLEKDPPLRPKSALDVALALDGCAPELGAAAVPPPSALGAPRRQALTAGERRLVAVVLATDTGLALDETVTPEQATGLSATLAATVRSHGGQLSPLGPHRFLVVFPSAGVATDQARRAARCALAISEAWTGAHVALALGWAEIGALPVGEVIDRAAALLDAEGEGRVRADDATVALLELHFQTARRGGVHEVLAERRVEERPRTLLGKPTRFVGREREIGTLLASLDEVVEEEVARVVLVTGVSGAGKSRLRHELSDRVRARDAPTAILDARAEELRAGSPLDVISALVRAWARASGFDPSNVRDALRARVDLRIPEGERADVLEFLAELAGAPASGEVSARLAAARLDARLLGEQMQRAFVTMLAHESAVHPLLIVVEDLHWADPQSIRFFDAALRDAANRPWLLLAFARPDVHERFPGLWKSRGVSELALGPLTRRACERLVVDVLGEVEAGLVERIVKHADGNALYLEELIRAASEGSLSTLPESVLAMVQARLEALDPMMRRALRAASVFGEVFAESAVQSLAGAGGSELDLALGRLVEAEVLLRSGAADEGRFAFRHAAVRDAAYGMLTDDDRRLGHGLAARWLAASGEQDARLIAGHYESAGDGESAAPWFARAARQALEKTDFEAALQLGARAIELGAAGSALAEALLARGSAESCLGHLADAGAELERALRAMSPDEHEQRLAVLRQLWNVGVFRQSSEAIRRAGTEALGLAERVGRVDLVAEARCALAMAEHCDERPDLSISGFRRAWESVGEAPSLIFGVSSFMLYHGGHYEEAERVSRQMLVRANDVRDYTTVVTLEANLGAILAGLGRYEEARHHFEAARAIGDRVGMPMVATRALSISGGHRIDVLDLDGAQRIAEETCEIGRALEFTTPRVSSTLDRAFVAAARGDAVGARRIADGVAGEVEKGTGFHGWLWRARETVLRGQIAELERDFEGALVIAERAIETWTRLQRQKYVAFAEVVRARALAGLGRRDDAVTRLSAFLRERLTLPDPALRLRVASTLFELERDEHARALALEAAASVERGLPPADRPLFRRSADALTA